MDNWKPLRPFLSGLLPGAGAGWAGHLVSDGLMLVGVVWWAAIAIGLVCMFWLIFEHNALIQQMQRDAAEDEEE